MLLLKWSGTIGMLRKAFGMSSPPILSPLASIFREGCVLGFLRTKRTMVRAARVGAIAVFMLSLSVWRVALFLPDFRPLSILRSLSVCCRQKQLVGTHFPLPKRLSSSFALVWLSATPFLTSSFKESQMNCVCSSVGRASMERRYYCLSSGVNSCGSTVTSRGAQMFVISRSPIAWNPVMNLLGSWWSGHCMSNAITAMRPTATFPATLLTVWGCCRLNCVSSPLHLAESVWSALDVHSLYACRWAASSIAVAAANARSGATGVSLLHGSFPVETMDVQASKACSACIPHPMSGVHSCLEWSPPRCLSNAWDVCAVHAEYVLIRLCTTVVCACLRHPANCSQLTNVFKPWEFVC